MILVPRAPPPLFLQVYAYDNILYNHLYSASLLQHKCETRPLILPGVDNYGCDDKRSAPSMSYHSATAENQSVAVYRTEQTVVESRLRQPALTLHGRNA